MALRIIRPERKIYHIPGLGIETREALASGAAEVTLVLQPAPAAGIDTLLSADTPNGSFGTNVGLFVAGNIYRTLIAFDLSAVPAGASIVSATLGMYCYLGGSATTPNIGAHRGLIQWWEGAGGGGVPGAGVDASTWSFRNYNGSVAWAGGAGGGSGSDYAAIATDTQAATTNNAWVNWNVTADVAAFVAGTDNYGWWLIATVETANLRRFWASDYTTDTSLRPKLTIIYTE